MGKLFVTFFALLLVTTVFTPAIAESTPTGSPSAGIEAVPDYKPVVSYIAVKEYPGWKNSERFEFSYIDGFLEVYNPEEPIVFTVEGKSDKMYVDETNGFSAFATMFDVTKRVGARAKMEYDSGRHAWTFKINAPKDYNGEYIFVVNLYCKKNNSPCAEVYGYGTQLDKILPFKVR